MASNFYKETKAIAYVTGNASLSALTINIADRLTIYNSHASSALSVAVGDFDFKVLAGQRETVDFKEPFTSVVVTDAAGKVWMYKTEL
jgi:hypothetical protein